MAKINGIERRRQAGVILALGTSAMSIALTGCSAMSFLITPVPGDRALYERVVTRESAFAGPKIAVIEVDGVIASGATSSLLGGESDNPLAMFKAKLDKAADDDAVKAVVLRINSPGGGVTASDIMYQEVKAFRSRTCKPVVASMIDVGASGAYYLACACDQIYANPTTVTGSIGVIMMLPNLTGTLEKIGARVNVIKSGPMKDSGSPFREMNEDDRRYFQTMVNEMYDRFIGVVCTGRPQLDQDRVRQLADGRVYLAADAKAKGLIDEIGMLEDGIAAAKRLAGIGQKCVRVVEYGHSYAYKPNAYAQTPGSAPTKQVNLVNIELPKAFSNPAPQFLYLWSPE